LEHVSQDIDKKVFGVFGKYNIEWFILFRHFCKPD
jgi:hypothetical protein